MTKILFTPAFEGDEYHNSEFHARHAGEYEVSERLAQYLTETFPGRFKPFIEKVEPASKSTKNNTSKKVEKKDKK